MSCNNCEWFEQCSGNSAELSCAEIKKRCEDEVLKSIFVKGNRGSQVEA